MKMNQGGWRRGTGNPFLTTLHCIQGFPPPRPLAAPGLGRSCEKGCGRAEFSCPPTRHP